ncbi:tail assembly chaperone [Hespellia stercorisuis]|uniref:Phage tail assembly chaperone protein, TAC n=1 Tax=Hespellia stercorisuis DSM 15480 TaxID=1121950 RepID=A0A1M6RGW0_9FIRM|nr:tail assembly chaperone [Hespellia stercorisuis]SHK31587.1 Phage tail assembly chaperone protein, TAC [Hespellia stercorisuis DSM 15480]
MMELTIENQVYQFHFGMGFLRDINKTVAMPVDGMPNVKKNVGLRYTIMKLYDGDVEGLEEVLNTANAGQSPRVTKMLLDSYIDDEDTDIDALFEEVMGFLKTANATKKETLSVLETIEKEKAKMAAKEVS